MAYSCLFPKILAAGLFSQGRYCWLMSCNRKVKSLSPLQKWALFWKSRSASEHSFGRLMLFLRHTIRKDMTLEHSGVVLRAFFRIKKWSVLWGLPQSTPFSHSWRCGLFQTPNWSMALIRGNPSPVMRQVSEWLQFQESPTEAKSEMIQEIWARRYFSDPWAARPQRTEELWISCWAPVTEVWEGGAYIGLDFGAEAQGALEGWSEHLLGMSFWKPWEGLPNASFPLGNPLHSSLGVGDIHHDFCNRIIYYFACKSL